MIRYHLAALTAEYSHRQQELEMRYVLRLMSIAMLALTGLVLPIPLVILLIHPLGWYSMEWPGIEQACACSDYSTCYIYQTSRDRCTHALIDYLYPIILSVEVGAVIAAVLVGLFFFLRKKTKPAPAEH